MDAIAKADGSVIIDTKLQTGGFSQGAKDLKKQFSGIMGGLKRIGTLAAAAFSVRAIVNFSKEAIALGSDLQEVQNVVDVTFGKLSGVVNDFAEKALESFGISELAAKQYSSTIGAMLKSMGFVPDQAAEMSMALTGLAGDMASFYNLSGDDAFTKIRAGISGETEPLKQLGINLSVANLEQYALTQGIRKSYDAMTQQEQALLRYNYLLSVTADAQGDFARTSDSWANQTRILAERFNQIKATIGQGLINAFTPVIRVVNTLLAGLQRLASAFQQLTAILFGKAGGTQQQLADIADGYEAAAGGAGDLEEATKGAGKAAKKALAGFDEITKLGEKSSGGGGGAGAAGGGATIPGFSLNGEVQENISPQIQKIADKIRTIIEPLRNIDFTPAKKSLANLGNEFQKLGAIIFDALGWVWTDILVPLSTWAIEEAAPASLDLLSEAFSFLSEVLAPVIDGLKRLFEWLQPVFQFIGESVLAVLEDWRSLFAKLAAVFEEKGPKIAEIFSQVGELLLMVWNSLLKPWLENMRKNWKQTFELLSDTVARAIGIVIDIFHGLLDFVLGVFTLDLERACNGFLEIIRGIVDVISGLIGSIINGFKNALEAGKRLIGIKTQTATTSVGGGSFGKVRAIETPQIPYLARGAVIPPNAPFMAMLGDQRHGTNIEAPLSTIQEAVALVMEDYAAANIAGHEATVAVLRDILEAVLGIEIGDDVLGKAANRYNARLATMRGDG